jgi:hypothetical protein
MTTLRNILMVICTAVILIEIMAYDMFPTEWNMALAIVAVACVSGIGVIAYATRNEVQR